jgi:hypothetical protein
MGYTPPGPPPPPLNVDRWGLPRDYATYMWLLYGRRVVDESPARIAFLHRDRADLPTFGQQIAWR